MNERYIYGTLIAKLMADRITEAEEQQLDEWVSVNPENMKLFENLINEYKSEWARQWFAEAGVSTRGIKWQRMGGWYRPESNVVHFYILAVVVFLALVGVYLVLEL